MNIITKSTHQIDKIRTSGQYLTELLLSLYQSIHPGMTLMQIEDIALRYIQHHKLIAAFHNFNKFPAHICTSLNDCLVHGVPDRTIIKDGDLLKVDIGINYCGAISDAAFSIVVWWADKNPEAQKMIDVSKWALDHGMWYVRNGNLIAHFSEQVADYVRNHWFSVIKTLTWHGVGSKVHEDPSVYNYPHPSTYKVKFKPGMVLALEPIIAKTSQWYIENPHHKRNLYTEHGDIGAQWEYTVAMTENGPEILAGIQSL